MTSTSAQLQCLPTHRPRAIHAGCAACVARLLAGGGAAAAAALPQQQPLRPPCAGHSSHPARPGAQHTGPDARRCGHNTSKLKSVQCVTGWCATQPKSGPQRTLRPPSRQLVQETSSTPGSCRVVLDRRQQHVHNMYTGNHRWADSLPSPSANPSQRCSYLCCVSPQVGERL